jgi:hypothetical protein
MMVDPLTAVYFVLATIALLGVGILVYAKVFVIDPLKRERRKRR